MQLTEFLTIVQATPTNLMKRLAFLAVLFLGLNATSSGLEIRGTFKVVSVAFDFDASSKFKKPFRKSFRGNVYRFLDNDKLYVTYSRRMESHGGYAVICGVLELCWPARGTCETPSHIEEYVIRSHSSTRLVLTQDVGHYEHLILTLERVGPDRP
jgi:hypothetical protein